MPDEKSVDFDEPLPKDELNQKVSPDDKAVLNEDAHTKHGTEFYDQAPGTGKDASGRAPEGGVTEGAGS